MYPFIASLQNMSAVSQHTERAQRQECASPSWPGRPYAMDRPTAHWEASNSQETGALRIALHSCSGTRVAECPPLEVSMCAGWPAAPSADGPGRRDALGLNLPVWLLSDAG